MRALTIRQPWAWAIVHAGKRIENRTRGTSYRGPLLIHAAKGCTREEYEEAVYSMEVTGLVRRVAHATPGPPVVPPLCDMLRGGVVAVAGLVDVLPPTTGDGPRVSRWYIPGQYGLMLARVQPTLFAPCKGSLGLWTPDPAIVAAALGPERAKEPA